MRQSALTGPTMLNSWKEIASYLDRGVRTVQRWERELQLPVHRIGKGKRSPVYAIATELKLWLCTAEIPHPKKTQVKPILVSRSVRPIDDSIRLLTAEDKCAHIVRIFVDHLEVIENMPIIRRGPHLPAPVRNDPETTMADSRAKGSAKPGSVRPS